MPSAGPTELLRLDRTVTALLDEWTARTKRRHAVAGALVGLEKILSLEQSGDAGIPQRLDALAQWLDMHGPQIAERGVRRGELESLVVAAEQLVNLRETTAPHDTKSRGRADELLDRLVTCIRQGTRHLGLEYTPAGLVESPDPIQHQSERVRRSLLERLSGFEDVKSAYRKSLDFQMERLEYFYQEDTHLLSVLDYQLKNLEARPNPEDEFFATCLIAFLKQHNYQVAPYEKRFQRVTARMAAPAEGTPR